MEFDEDLVNLLVVFISYWFWYGIYGVDFEIVGEMIILNCELMMVVGVLFLGFYFLLCYDIWGVLRFGCFWFEGFVFGFVKFV